MGSGKYKKFTKEDAQKVATQWKKQKKQGIDKSPNPAVGSPQR